MKIVSNNDLKIYLTRDLVAIEKDVLMSLMVKENSSYKTAKILGVSQSTILRAKKHFEIKYDGRRNKKVSKKKIGILKQYGLNSWNDGLAEREKTVCLFCKKEFEHSSSKIRKYCSIKCTNLSLSKRYSGEKFSGKNNPNFGNGEKLKQAWKNGFYDDRELPPHSYGNGAYHNGIWMRSSWEIKYALYLEKLNIKYEYEKTRFKLKNGKTYTPDFYLIEREIYIEVKGYWYKKAAEKFKLFLEEFKEITIVIEDKVDAWKIK